MIRVRLIARLDFGQSMSTDRRPVWDKIKERLWPTMSLAILSLGISLAVAIPVGIYSAARQNRLFDTISSTILYALYSVPSYVMAVPLILLLATERQRHDIGKGLTQLTPILPHSLQIFIHEAHHSLAIDDPVDHIARIRVRHELEARIPIEQFPGLLH